MIRTSFRTLSILFIIVLLYSTSQPFLLSMVVANASASQAGWRLEIEEGKSARSTLTINNRCSEPHRFRVKSSVKYLEFEEPTNSVLIEATSNKQLGVRFDATGLKSKIYRSKVVVECLDCKKMLKCTQDRDEVSVEMIVIKSSTQKAREIARPNGPVNLSVASAGSSLHFQSMQATFHKVDANQAIPEFRGLSAQAVVNRPPSPDEPLYIKLKLTCDNGRKATFNVTGYWSAKEAIDWVEKNCGDSVTIAW